MTLASTADIANNVTASPDPVKKGRRESFDDIYNQAVMAEINERAKGWNGERRLPAQIQWTLNACRKVFDRLEEAEGENEKLAKQLAELTNVVAGLADLARKGK